MVRCRTAVGVANLANRSRVATVSGALVNSAAEHTWIPARILDRIGVKREKKDLSFVMANGQTITRSVGFAIVRVGETFTVDEVVFGEPGDQILLGARSLEGLNLMIHPKLKRLVAAGPIPAAHAC